ncbi:MAG: hypothetical protein ACRC20_08235 [Segniliparus sp.]|uniref:hypothetical protein n=1 Tax=Segniliparus sp. TaxID=2804064 RepID=UPI003F4038C1
MIVRLNRRLPRTDLQSQARAAQYAEEARGALAKARRLHRTAREQLAEGRLGEAIRETIAEALFL